MFSHTGQFWSYKDVAIWPRPVQQPHPPIWIPVVGSKESIDFAARHDAAITPGLAPGGLQDDIIRHFAERLAHHGRRITPDHLSVSVSAYVADSKAKAVEENGPYTLYFSRTLFSHGNFTETSLQRQAGYSTQTSTDYVRQENLRAAEHARQDFRSMTMDDIARMAEKMPWGTPQEVAARIIALAEHTGANTVQLNFNRGAMPQDMFMNQIERFAREVLPRLQKHDIKTVPAAEEVLA